MENFKIDQTAIKVESVHYSCKGQTENGRVFVVKYKIDTDKGVTITNIILEGEERHKDWKSYNEDNVKKSEIFDFFMKTISN